MKKQTCEYCGKPNIDGRHRNMCSKNPKNMTTEDLPSEVVPESPQRPQEGQEAPSEEKHGETVGHVVASEVNTADERMCRRCGKHPARRLNALDWRCPACGDYGPKSAKSV